jgi:hypothetical protein
LVEQLIRNQQVSSSNLLVGSSSNPATAGFFRCAIVMAPRGGRILSPTLAPADCATVAINDLEQQTVACRGLPVRVGICIVQSSVQVCGGTIELIGFLIFRLLDRKPIEIDSIFLGWESVLLCHTNYRSWLNVWCAVSVPGTPLRRNRISRPQSPLTR